MYPINFATCSAVDVIERSLVCHPTAWADRMIAAQESHLLFALETHDARASQAAARAADAAERGRLIAAKYDARNAALRIAACGVSEIVQAFQAAAELQLIPRTMRGDIITRVPVPA